MEKTLLQIQDYIFQNEVEMALKKLQSIFSIAGSELVNDVILLMAQLKKLQSDIRKGIIDYATENLVHNRIVNSVLSLTKEIETEPEQFVKFVEVEAELDKSIKEKIDEELPISMKDSLFERLSYVKEKNLEVNAIWIDDFPSNNRYESKVLKSVGVKIDYAKSSEEGYEMLKTKNYELILSDIARNDINDEGLRFHKKLIDESIYIPLVFYTGFVDKEKGVPPYAFGIADLPNELIHLVLDVIERKY